MRIHFGSEKNNLKESFSSDQLYSAFLNSASLMYPDEIDEIHENFIKDNILSSLFYGIELIDKVNKSTSTIYFLPKPIKIEIQDDNYIYHKKLKKIKFVSVKLLKYILNNWQSDEKKFIVNLDKVISIDGRFALLEEEIKNQNISRKELEQIEIINKKFRPRISIDRFTQNSKELYRQEYVEIKTTDLTKIKINPFMYFITNEEMDDKTLAIFRFMVEQGLGGKRTVGLGLFDEIKVETPPEITKLFGGKSSYYYNISRVFPKETEVDQLLYYNLNKRDGYIYSKGGQSMKRKTIRMIEEGSIFNNNIDGEVIDTAPEIYKKHPVYIYGKAMNIGFGSGNYEI